MPTLFAAVQNEGTQIQCVATMGTVTLSDITISPVADNIPVLRSTALPRDDSCEAIFQLIGTVEIPLIGSTYPVAIQGECRGLLDNGTLHIHSTSADAYVKEIRVTSCLSLEEVHIHLSSCRYRADLTIKAEVRYHQRAIRAGGSMHCQIVYLQKPTKCISALFAILKNAYATITPEISLDNGTIRFALCSIIAEIPAFNHSFDDEEEMLFQFEQPINLGNCQIAGLPEEPMTTGLQLFPDADGLVALAMEIFPAQIKLPFIGGGCTLFIHHTRYDEPFILNTCTSWKASLSNNVRFEVTTLSGDKPETILKSHILIAGTVNGEGLTPPLISIAPEALFTGTIFPDKPFAQELPQQHLSVTLHADGTSDFPLLLPNPLKIHDNTTLFTVDNSRVVAATAGRYGLRICQPVVLEQSQQKRIINECVIDANGRLAEILQVTSKHPALQ